MEYSNKVSQIFFHGEENHYSWMEAVKSIESQGIGLREGKGEMGLPLRCS